MDCEEMLGVVGYLVQSVSKQLYHQVGAIGVDRKLESINVNVENEVIYFP